MDFGERLKTERKKINWTQEAVAKKLNVSRQTISSWENERSYPDIQNLVALSELYQVSLDVLLKDETLLKDLEEQAIPGKRAIKVIQISYWFNILLLVVSLLNGVLNFKQPNELVSTPYLILLLIVNGLIFLLFRLYITDKKVARAAFVKFVLVLVAGLLFSLTLVAVNSAGISAYALGVSTGRSVKLILYLVCFSFCFLTPKKSE